ncbi:MAG: TfoX/Sxy family protein [Anaerolineae bacterium]|nr:TfoX/Sxy family protein [Anaerolineae bacterium]
MLKDLKSLGPQAIAWLNSLGIYSEADLRALGPVAAYRQLKLAYPDRVTRNALWSLAGALAGVDWRALPPEYKAELLAELEQG